MAFLRRMTLVLFATASGCVINVGEDDCSKCDNAPRCHSHLDEATMDCSCDAGHQWANPGNDNDFECRKIPPKPGTSECIEDNSYVQGDSCFCNEGFVWCSGDQQDLTCCVDENQATGPFVATDTDTDTDGSGETGGREVELPPCAAANEGALGCTNPDMDTPGPTFQCVGGAWVEFAQDAHCQSQDPPQDFAYGCYLLEGMPQVLCGVGPGTACSDEPQACIDGTTLHVCQYGRVTARDCEGFCKDEAELLMEPVMTAHGTCDADACACCQEGEEGCPM